MVNLEFDEFPKCGLKWAMLAPVQITPLLYHSFILLFISAWLGNPGQEFAHVKKLKEIHQSKAAMYQKTLFDLLMTFLCNFQKTKTMWNVIWLDITRPVEVDYWIVEQHNMLLIHRLWRSDKNLYRQTFLNRQYFMSMKNFGGEFLANFKLLANLLLIQKVFVKQVN